MSENKSRLAVALVKALIRSSQRVPLFRARGSYGSDKDRPLASQPDPLRYGLIEFEDGPQFQTYIRDHDFLREISGKRVLDLGSGYGGRTVWMSTWAKHVLGIEVFPTMVQAGRDLALHMSRTNVSFQLGGEDHIDLPNSALDVVVSFDVLEHVKCPDVIMREIYRVLVPGGLAFVVFTPYYGMFAHHLGYITLAPAVHWFFSPKVLISAINDLLAHDNKFSKIGVAQQPQPSRSYNGARWCLPTLNGMTMSEYTKLVQSSGFHIESMRATPLVHKLRRRSMLAQAANRMLMGLPMGEELFAHNLASVLRKPF